MKRDVLVLFALVGWALALPRYASEFAVSLALTCLMYSALATSWSLFCGSTRYLSLATSAFFGIGAYTSALALAHTGWLGAIVLGRGCSRRRWRSSMGAAVLHLRGTYFAVLTFGMTELIRHAITYFEKQRHRHRGPRARGGARARHGVPDGAGDRRRSRWRRRSSCARSRFGLAMAGIGADEQRAADAGRRHAARQDRRLRAHRRFRRRGGRGDERALDLHRSGHRVQPVHRLPDRADRARSAAPPRCGGR